MTSEETNRSSNADATTNNIDDAEMKELFTAFDTVSASEDLIQRTLSAIETEAPATKTVPSRKSKWRIIRTFAIAACLAFACFGGVAYATPAATVTMQTDQGAIELTLNRFGRTLSVQATDSGTEDIVKRVEVRNKKYEDSISLLLEQVGQAEGQEVEIEVQSNDATMRENLEQRGRNEIERRGFGPKDAASAPAQTPQTAPDVQAPQGMQGTQAPQTPPAVDNQQSPQNEQSAESQQGTQAPPAANDQQMPQNAPMGEDQEGAQGTPNPQTPQGNAGSPERSEQENRVDGGMNTVESSPRGMENPQTAQAPTPNNNANQSQPLNNMAHNEAAMGGPSADMQP